MRVEGGGKEGRRGSRKRHAEEGAKKKRRQEQRSDVQRWEKGKEMMGIPKKKHAKLPCLSSCESPKVQSEGEWICLQGREHSGQTQSHSIQYRVLRVHTQTTLKERNKKTFCAKINFVGHISMTKARSHVIYTVPRCVHACGHGYIIQR